MRQVVLFETLHFLTRDDLDACHLASSFWSNTIVRTAKTLPLRYIHYAELTECPANERVTVFLTGDDSVYHLKGRFINRYEPLVPADDYADLLRLFDNSYVEQLRVCLSCGDFLDYWLRHEEETTCRIGTIDPHHSIGSPVHSVHSDDDYVHRLACITNALRPRAYDVGMSDFPNAFAYLALYSQELTLNCAPHLKIHFGKFFTILWAEKTEEKLNKLSDCLFHANGLQQCDITFEGCPVDAEWIDSIIESAEHAATTLASLSVMWDVDDDELPFISRLQAPSSTVAKPPRDDFVENFATQKDIDEFEESPVHLFTFRSAKSGRVLNVYNWTMIETGEDDKSRSVALLFETQS